MSRRVRARSESLPSPVLVDSGPGDGTADLVKDDFNHWTVLIYPEIGMEQEPPVRPISVINEFTSSPDDAKKIVSEAAQNAREGVVFADEIVPQAGTQVTEIWKINDRFNVIRGIYEALESALNSRDITFGAEAKLFPARKPTFAVFEKGIIVPERDLWVGAIRLEKMVRRSVNRPIVQCQLMPFEPYEV
ncbi:hypothetical protein HY857_00565 [Candidatus Saccharibacteria bacterium]|nr:hypothetical protein [Candidatus Saccharibacteria bacterium]